MSEDRCPKCGGDLRFVDKHTFTGREFRECRCVDCNEEVVEGGDVALWQVLHDASEAAERQRQEHEAKRPWWRFWKR